MSESLHGDLAGAARVDTKAMRWTPSPSGSVWRKRVHLVGPPEAGQVTSVVRYEPGSHFAAHDHPDGEEILVLDGVFSDEHGDWPAGTYLLNPEGFRHAPFSRPGCTLFVKLRQLPGPGRRHLAIDVNALEWRPGTHAGVTEKLLAAQPGFSDLTKLARWAGSLDLGAVTYAQGAELFVLEGAFSDESGTHTQGTWLRFPVGATHRPLASRAGCTLYVKTGGLRYLRSAG
ncbi:MAG TPA: cupin domain-containing protein [Myxococcota bacterium]|nr:cupin domain-containing protein [Myxococcota bacterium]